LWLRFITGLISLILFHSSSFAETSEISNQPVNPFQSDYILVEALSNFPVGPALDRFRPYRRTPGVTYRHVLNRDWIVGVSLGFKSFRRKDIDREFALLSVSNQAQYVMRLYHPAYLLIGPKWLYLLASQRARFPLVRDPDYETEIGAGLTTSFAYIVGKEWLLTLRFDRWRGTKTNRLHGFEVALGLAKSLKF
jgi:hypothetical protein